MTEADWLASDDPARMLAALQDGGAFAGQARRAGDRVLRLFACACARQAWGLLIDDAPCLRCGGGGTLRPSVTRTCPDCQGSGRLNRPRRAVEVAERFADGLAAEGELRHTFSGALDACNYLAAPCAKNSSAAHLAHLCADEGPRLGREFVTVARRAGLTPTLQADLLRDVAGNPFRPATLGPAWITPTAVSLAAAAYDERIPPGLLDPVRLAVLADALEEVGCDDDEILFHLRGVAGCPKCDGVGGYYLDGPAARWRRCAVCKGEGLVPPSPHVRGCWAVDLVLGKE